MNRDQLLDLLPERPKNEMALQRLEEQLNTGAGVIPFVGAGLSMPLGFPGWTKFLLMLAEPQGVASQVREHLALGQYEEAAEILEDSYGPVRFQDMLLHTFGPSRIEGKPLAGAVCLLPRISRGPVITTNFDPVLERVFDAGNARFEQLIWGSRLESGRQAFREQRPILLKLHGDAHDPEDRVLTRRDYDRHYGHPDEINTSKNLPQLLCDILNMYRLLFIGCSLQMDRTVSILQRLNQVNVGSKHFAIVARPDTDDAARALDQRLGSHGIMPIWLPSGRFDLIATILEYLGGINPQRGRRNGHGALSRGNLPLGRPPFIGREVLCAQVRQRIAAHRLVTLAGAGGCGKTRLAEEVADRAKEEYEEVWIVALASKTDKAAVPQEIAITLKIAEQSKSPPRAALVDYLSDRKSLLVLDNCEHLVDSCREIIDELLSKCPQVHILATSREVLNTQYDEIVEWIGGLSLPSLHDARDLAHLKRSEAVQLFELRGNAAANFHLDLGNAAAVAQICIRLGGLPLNLELAAARLDTLTPLEIAAHLDECMTLLANERTHGRKEHMSVAETIRWSYNLLAEEEQQLIRRLAVFEGAWSWEAAHPVCAPEIAKLAVNSRLNQLVRKSLIVHKSPGRNGKKRLFLLETIQQFGLGEMQPGELAETRSRHRDFVLAHMERVAPLLANTPDEQLLDEIEEERDDLLAALQWSITSQASDSALRLGAAMWRFWELRGYFADGRALFEPLLNLPHTHESTAARGHVLSGVGLLAYRQGDVHTARARFSAALELERQRHDNERIAICLNDMGIVSHLAGDYAAAADYYAQSLELKSFCSKRDVGATYFNAGGLALALGDVHKAVPLLQSGLELFREVNNKSDMAYALTALARAAIMQNDLPLAFSYLQQALNYRRVLGHIRGLAETLNVLGHAALKAGDVPAARRYLHKSLARIQQVKDSRGKADTMDSIMLLAVADGRMHDAVRLAMALAKFRREIGIPRRPAFEQQHTEELKRAQAALSAEDYPKAVRAGETDDVNRMMTTCARILAK